MNSFGGFVKYPDPFYPHMLVKSRAEQILRRIQGYNYNISPFKPEDFSLFNGRIIAVSRLSLSNILPTKLRHISNARILIQQTCLFS